MARPEYPQAMNDNLVALDLTRFTRADAQKLADLQKKVTMMRRWCRCERAEKNRRDTFELYSGDSGAQPYANYRITRREDGGYLLEDGRSEAHIAGGRTIDSVIDALPDDFYFTKYLT
jgi:hypothetical protein